MLNGKVFLAYLLFIVITAAIPALIFSNFILAAIIGGSIAILWWIIAWIWGDVILLKTLKPEPYNVGLYPEIATLVKNKAIGPNMRTPSLWLLGNVSPMVMSLGLSPKKSHLIISHGFFKNIEDKAQIGLVMREIESIREGATAANTGLATLFWIILLPGRLGTLIQGKPTSEPNLIEMILNMIPAFLVGYPLSLIGRNTRTAHKIDGGTLRRLENPDYLPYGLMKLSDAVLALPFEIDLALSPCCIINPNARDPYQVLFKVHPATPKRIDRLRIRAKASRKQLHT